eukprot:scaffold59754_cov43-Prasinocladus_malaysianus.AAC.1
MSQAYYRPFHPGCRPHSRVNCTVATVTVPQLEALMLRRICGVQVYKLARVWCGCVRDLGPSLRGLAANPLRPADPLDMLGNSSGFGRCVCVEFVSPILTWICVVNSSCLLISQAAEFAAV